MDYENPIEMTCIFPMKWIIIQHGKQRSFVKQVFGFTEPFVCMLETDDCEGKENEVYLMECKRS